MWFIVFLDEHRFEDRFLGQQTLIQSFGRHNGDRIWGSNLEGDKLHVTARDHHLFD
jgi:hypothetical protein